MQGAIAGRRKGAEKYATETRRVHGESLCSVPGLLFKNRADRVRDLFNAGNDHTM